MTAPARKTARPRVIVPASSPGFSTFVNNRLTGRFELDAFGYDAELAAAAAPFAALRWSIDVDAADLIPSGPALVVFSQRLGISEPWVLMSAFRTLGHEVRPVGMPDRQPVAATLARIGWIPPTAADVRAVLRHGSFAALGLSRSPRHRFRPGSLDVDLLQAAIDLRIPVVPVAVVGRELGRRWQVIVGASISTKRRSTLTAAELANRSRERVSQLLEAAKRQRLFL